MRANSMDSTPKPRRNLNVQPTIKVPSGYKLLERPRGHLPILNVMEANL